VAGPQLNYGNWVRKRILLRHPKIFGKVAILSGRK